MTHKPGFVNWSLHNRVSGLLSLLWESAVPKAYWIARVDVKDPEAYKAYVLGASAAFSAHGAKFLARGGRSEGLEGHARARNIVIEFPSYQAALDCFNSAAYQAARAHRAAASVNEIVIVEGVEPQDQKG
jgi:uncharacterized protein (DUF1330 family)